MFSWRSSFFEKPKSVMAMSANALTLGSLLAAFAEASADLTLQPGEALAETGRRDDTEHVARFDFTLMLRSAERRVSKHELRQLHPSRRTPSACSSG